MGKTTKKFLLLANVVLLILICFFAIKAFNGRAAEIAMERMKDVCQNIVTNVDSGAMTIEAASAYARAKTTVGEYVPDVAVRQNETDIILRTNDPSITTNLLKSKESDFVDVNCTMMSAQ